MCCTLVTPSDAACSSARSIAWRRWSWRGIGDDFVDQIGGRVFQCAGRIALRIANDDASVGIGSLRRDARQFQATELARIMWPS